jgi:EAL domain-containing protein (putative c-di-GMP-specific phosphodiesterase class I)
VPERDCIIELGCDLLQGYLLAKPGPAFPTFSWGG